MRTVPIRFSRSEHRLLRRFAAAQGVSVETLVREALALAPIDTPPACAERLRVVGSDGARTATEGEHDHAVPTG